MASLMGTRVSYESSEEGREFLRARLAMFGGSVFLISLAFYVLSNTASFLVPSQTLAKWFVLPSNQFHLGQTFVLLALWIICRFGKMGLRALYALDAGAMFLVSGFHALIGLSWLSEREMLSGVAFVHETSALPIVMATIVVSIARAIFVPSTEARTIVVGTLAGIPTVLAAYLIHLRTAPEPGWALLLTSRAAIWTLVGIAVSAIASRVVYHLQAQVRDAEKLGQYTLEAKIGEGGMGIVYRASHAMLRRPTAIKLLPPERAGEHNLVRFEREVQLTSMLTHPNTIAIYDYGRTPEGTFYYAMEYLEGIDLEGLVRAEGPQPSARVAYIMEQVAGALAEAHGIGLIHRDIKPANIYLCERGGALDVAKVLDFGLVKQLHAANDAKLSATNVLTGTPLYLAPEAILAPQKIDARSDLYALGCVGYFLLTGKPVFSGRTLLEICGQHLHIAPVPPSERVAEWVSPELEALILACLEKDPDKRPRDARELGDRIALLDDLPRWTEAQARARWQREPATLPSQVAEHLSRTASPSAVRSFGGASPSGRESAASETSVALGAPRG